MRNGEDGDAEVKIIDFDWAGKCGEVKYPMMRNDAQIKWPAKCLTPIIADYDRDQVRMAMDDAFGAGGTQ